MTDTLREQMLRRVHQSEDTPDVVDKILALPIFAEVEAALEPWAKFADPNNRVPPDYAVTKGSPLAKRQPTMGDCYCARTTLAKLRGEDHG